MSNCSKMRNAFSEESRSRNSSTFTSGRSEEHTSELQSPCNLVCRLLLEKKKKRHRPHQYRYMVAHPSDNQRSCRCATLARPSLKPAAPPLPRLLQLSCGAAVFPGIVRTC